MDITVHARISEFVKSSALFPPRRPGHDGFDLLDVVVVNPAAKDPAKMLIPTGTNLNKHFTHHKIHRRNESRDIHSKKEVRRSEETFALTEEFKTALGMKGAGVSTNGSHESTTNVNLLISDEKTYSISGATFHLIDQVVRSRFCSIVENAAKYVITGKTKESWYNSFFGKQEETHYVAVITKSYHGELSIEESDDNSLGLGASVKLEAPIASFGEASLNGSISGCSCHTSTSKGIVGVQLLCFPFRRAENDGDYNVCDPFALKWLDAKERAKLTKISKDRHWELIENKGDSEIFYERGRRSRSKSFFCKFASESANFDHFRLTSLMAVAIVMLIVKVTLNGLIEQAETHYS